MTKLEYAKETIAELSDDYSMPWSFYPCLEWIFGKTSHGYGAITINDRMYAAHRVSYVEQFGPIKEKDSIGHHCRNNKCFRPIHLFLEPYQPDWIVDFVRIEKELNPPISAPCFEWPFIRNECGYGTIAIKRKWFRAHRLVFEQFYGSIDERHLCHHCDNQPCIRPAHLFLGTPAENMADKTVKGRQSMGETSHSKLREVDIHEIFKMYNSGSSMGDVGSRFGVSGESIHAILHKKTWGHVKTESLRTDLKRIPHGGSHYNATLNEEVVREIFRLYREGRYTQREIAKLVGANFNNVWSVLHRKSWAHVKID